MKILVPFVDFTRALSPKNKHKWSGYNTDKSGLFARHICTKTRHIP